MKLKRVAWNKGIPMKENTKKKLSESIKEGFRKGRIHPNLGKHPTKESRKKMSISHIGNKIPKNVIEKRVKTWKRRYYNGKFKQGMTGKIPYSKGKTYEEIFGKEKSKQLKEKISKKIKKYFQIKENHPIWKGGISKEEYGIDWTNELKKKIRKRDDWKCMLCKCKNKQLIVHHINYDKKNNDEINLITLCRSCHTKIGEKQKKFWKQLFLKILKNG